MNANQKFRLLTVLTLTAACSFAQSVRVRDLRLDSPVDSNTIAVAYAQITYAIATAVRLGQLDQDSLARAIAVGRDLALIETTTNGWVVAVSNLVEVDQAHVPGVLLVGDTIFGVPSSSKGRIDLDGCDFYYNRQIPGDGTHTNGWGNLVTDPYLDWLLGTFFSDWSAQTNAMWNALETLADLPDTIADDLAIYNSLTNVQATVGTIRDEINATNLVIRSVIAEAISHASGGGSAWTSSSNSDGNIELSDHEICVCDYGDEYPSYYITTPEWTGTPTHSYILFTSASNWGNNYPSINVSTGADYIYCDENGAPGNYWSSGGMYLFEFWMMAEEILFVRVNPVMDASF